MAKLPFLVRTAHGDIPVANIKFGLSLAVPERKAGKPATILVKNADGSLSPSPEAEQSILARLNRVPTVKTASVGDLDLYTALAEAAAEFTKLAKVALKRELNEKEQATVIDTMETVSSALSSEEDE